MLGLLSSWSRFWLEEAVVACSRLLEQIACQPLMIEACACRSDAYDRTDLSRCSFEISDLRISVSGFSG
jgi:hypothetical protein